MAENQSFGPKKLEQLERALDAAWAEVEGSVPESFREDTRLEMASAVMHAARAGRTKFKQLKAAALAAVSWHS